MMRKVVLWVIFWGMASALLPSDTGELEPKIRLNFEFGIDNLERRYYRPEFTIVLPLRNHSHFFLQTRYHEWMNGRLQGRIDFWVNAGVEKTIDSGFAFSFRIHHFCRHETLRQVKEVFNLNEFVGLAGWRREHWSFLGGVGVYAGGNAEYRRLALFTMEIAPFFLSEVRFFGEARWVDFSRIIYEAGLYLHLKRGTELFVQNTRSYDSKTMSMIGVRFSTQNGSGTYLDQVILSFGVSPEHRKYKLTVDGEYRFEFFVKEKSRMLAEVVFHTPILNGDRFLGTFRPDLMGYSIGLRYQVRLRNRLSVFWYGLYRLHMPVDREESFSGELGTGLGLGNQEDFFRLDKPFRYEVTAGVNFKKNADISLSAGLHSPMKRAMRIGADFHCRMNSSEKEVMIRAFLAVQGEVSIRPFVSFDRTWTRNSLYQTYSRFSIGCMFLCWFE